MQPHRNLLRVALLFSLLVSACSSGGAPTPATTATSPPAAVAKPTPGQGTGAPPATANPATQPAQPASGQTAQQGGSSQASGDLGANSDAPAAPIVARSHTTGRPITLEVWLT